MSFSYEVTQLATSPMMQVRLEIGDTDSTEPLMQDEEIELIYLQTGTLNGTAARCCELIARKFARLVSKALGPARVEAQQRYEHYRNEAIRLKSTTFSANAPSAGGMYKSEDLEDTNIKPAIFSKDMMNADYGDEESERLGY